MKYQEALDSRGLKKEDLSKAIQKKIDVVDKLAVKIEDLSNYELDADGIESLNSIRENVEVLDEDLVKSINKFDPEVQERRMKAVAEMNEKKKNGGASSITTSKPAPEVQQEPLVFETAAAATPPPPPPVQERVVEQQEVQPEPETQTHIDEIDDDDDVEVEEFAKHGADKPKKRNMSLILIGVGAFFLTWGAVNFFRDKK
jgi:hypothetical protein